METAQEQAATGGHCVHGTATGTPGGIDLMCGLCEAGLFDFIEAPRYALMLEGRPFTNTVWGDTAPSVEAACKRVRGIFANITMDLGEWSAEKVANGYWA